MFWRHMASFTALACAALLAAPTLPSAQAAWMENFSGVTDGTALSSVSGWSGTGTATVESAAGYADQGIDQISGTYVRTLSDSEKLTAATGGTFSISWKLDYSDDRYMGLLLTLGNDNGNNAFRINITSSSQKDPTSGWSQRDNKISISSGGTKAAPIWTTFTSSNGYNSSGRWLVQTWYTLTISNIDLAAGTGTLNLYETDNTSTVKIANAAITATSGTNPFNSIDYFSFAPGGSNHHPFDIDNLSLTAAPEPASLALLALGGLCLMGRRRQRA